jgi:DNA mismatch repair protein MutL
MSQIRVLPEILSNKIAAGEVVERPASVVKELVENALDAGSTRIVIDVAKGGRTQIRVSDNGAGMGKDDALLSLERYATSKIYSDDDLFAITTLGFRGEALPSIAAVSRFTMVTKDKGSAAGVQIIIDGGKLKKVLETGAPRGTMITVRQLFFNTPARRKFLKAISTEMGHIADTVASIAMAQPHVQFKLLHNDRMVKSWSKASDPVDRVADILGRSMKDNLLSLSAEEDGIVLAGWIASPHITRSTSRGIYVYVNKRFVRDRIITHALFAGYQGRLMKGRYPVAAIFIEVPCAEVDINVHPTKHEVRFVNQSRVHDMVAKTIAAALRADAQPKWRAQPLSEKVPAIEKPRISEDRPDFLFSADRSPNDNKDTAKKDGPAFSPAPQLERVQRTSAPQQASLWQHSFLRGLRIIGQLHDTYILCESDEGLIVVDQHAAHERIMFEALKKRSEKSTYASQKRLLPQTFEMGFRETAILQELIPEFRAYGLEIEPFGSNTFVIKAVPTFLEKNPIEPIIREIIETAVKIGISTDLSSIVDESLMILACHGAIRANQRLSHEQIRGLFAQLEACENPAHCPHGRPIWLTWSTKYLQKAFKRIV